MIDKIKNNHILKNFIDTNLCENGVCIIISEEIKEYAAIKVDKYYNSLNIKNTPASVDILLIVKCENYDLGLYLVELKSAQKVRTLDKQNIKLKFKNTINLFIQIEFKSLLNIKYQKVNLYLCSKIKNNPRDNLFKKISLELGSFNFNGLKCFIEIQPNNTLINKC